MPGGHPPWNFIEFRGKYSRGGYDARYEGGYVIPPFTTPTTNSKGKTTANVLPQGSLIHIYSLMFHGVPLTPRSRRRYASRLNREQEDNERPRRAPVSNALSNRSPKFRFGVANKQTRTMVYRHQGLLLRHLEVIRAYQGAQSRARVHHRTVAKPNGDDARGNGVSVNNSNRIQR
jgi:hypothetical protein